MKDEVGRCFWADHKSLTDLIVRFRDSAKSHRGARLTMCPSPPQLTKSLRRFELPIVDGEDVMIINSPITSAWRGRRAESFVYGLDVPKIPGINQGMEEDRKSTYRLERGVDDEKKEEWYNTPETLGERGRDYMVRQPASEVCAQETRHCHFQQLKRFTTERTLSFHFIPEFPSYWG